MSTATPWRRLLRASGAIIFGKVRCRSWCLARCFFVAGKLFGHTYGDFVQTLISLEPIIWVAWGYCQLTGTYNTIVFQSRRVDFECVLDLLKSPNILSSPQQSCELHQIQFGNIFNGSVCVWNSSRHRLQLSTISCCNEAIIMTEVFEIQMQ